MTKKNDSFHDKIPEKIKNQWWKSKTSKITGIALLLIFIAGLAVWFFVFRPYVSTDDARINATIVQVANAGGEQPDTKSFS